MVISQDMLCCVFKTQHSSFIINKEIDSGPTHNQHNYLHVKSQKPLIQKSPWNYLLYDNDYPNNSHIWPQNLSNHLNLDKNRNYSLIPILFLMNSYHSFTRSSHRGFNTRINRRISHRLTKLHQNSLARLVHTFS